MTDPAVPWRATRRFAAIFGAGLVVGQIGQLVWLSIGSRTMSTGAFGTVLAAQALYAVLQLVIEGGAAFHGARLAAAQELDAAARSSVIRLRLQLGFAGVAVAMAFGVAGGYDALAALAPFGLALVLFALFTHWESFGRGSSGPWSTYLVLRALVLTLASGAFLIAEATFPLYGAGLAECAAIVATSLAFGFRPLQDLRLGLRARNAPWRSALSVGLPSVTWQVGLAAGTVLLSTFGAPAQAARLGVSVRLLTGVNQLAAVLATALFPRLAGSASGSRQYAHDDAAIGLLVRVACAVGLAASALLLIDPGFFVQLFLDHTDSDSEATAALVLAAGPVTTLLVALSMVLTARRLEAAFLVPFLVGTGGVLVASSVALLADPESPALWLAGVFVAGQLVTMLLLVPRAVAAMPSVPGLRLVGLNSIPVALLASIAAIISELRVEVALVELVLAGALLAAASRDARRRAERVP